MKWLRDLYRRNLALVSERRSPNADLIAAIEARTEALKANTDAMDDLRHTTERFIEEIRSVQQYGLRINK